MRWVLLLIFLAGCSSRPQLNNKLKPFITDGCTLYPDGTWLHCCIVHDMYYWAGGTSSERDAADLELKQCVEKVASKTRARMMLSGVHLGGRANGVLPWAWGFGWDTNMGYKKLDLSDKSKIIALEDSILPSLKLFGKKLKSRQMKYILHKVQDFKMDLKTADTPKKISDDK